MNLTVLDLLNITHAHEHKLAQYSPRQTFRSVSTDSRTIKKGDLFVALRGEKFDGHDFIGVARKQGARAAIVDVRWFRKQKKVSLPCLVVKNTLDAFGELARGYRRKFSLPILIIAGSNGKTTTKDLIAHTLGMKYDVLKTEANFNNQVGLPQMLFKLKKQHQIAVLEIGTNHPGEIAWLTNTSEPTHALVTNIGREHLEFFKNLDGVAREELSALAITEELGGFGFINVDDPYIRPGREIFQEWSIAYGTDRQADVRAKSLGMNPAGKQRVKIVAGKTNLSVKSNIIADYAANMIAGVTAVALHFGIPKVQIKEALESYAPHSKRMEIVRLRKGITIINDSYNANPESFRSALETLARMKGRRLIAAGDMFELGRASAGEHRELGKRMSLYPFSGIYLTGTAMKYAYAALPARRKKASVHGPKAVIIDRLKRTLRKGDILLVKGSRGMKMEEIVSELRTA